VKPKHKPKREEDRGGGTIPYRKKSFNKGNERTEGRKRQEGKKLPKKTLSERRKKAKRKTTGLQREDGIYEPKIAERRLVATVHEYGNVSERNPTKWGKTARKPPNVKKDHKTNQASKRVESSQ